LGTVSSIRNPRLASKLGFAKGEDAERMFGGHGKVTSGLGKIPRSLEEKSNLGGNLGNVSVVKVKQGSCSDAAPRCFSGRLNRVVERAIVEKVNEPVAHAKAAMRQILLPERLNESVHMMKPVKMFFRIRKVHAECACDNRRVKLESLDARRRQQLSIRIRKKIDFPLHHADDRLRQIAFDIGQLFRQLPNFTRLEDRLLVAQVAQEFYHEKRVAFGLRVYQFGKDLRESCSA
jgi:hypothetical protein